MKTLILAAFLLLAPAVHAQEPEVEVTCEQNQDDINFVRGRLIDLKDKHNAETDERHKMLIRVEGNAVQEMYNFLNNWRKKHCTDV